MQEEKRITKETNPQLELIKITSVDLQKKILDPIIIQTVGEIVQINNVFIIQKFHRDKDLFLTQQK